MTVNFSSNCKKGATPFFCKQSVFDPCPENCLSFSEKLPQEIVYQFFGKWSTKFYCLNIQTF